MSGRLSEEPLAPDATPDLAGVVLGGQTLENVLGLVVELALASIGAADGASAVVGRPEPGWTSASSGNVQALEAVEHGCTRGPCGEAMVTRRRENVDLVGSRERWPDFSSAALAIGFRSLLALPLSADDRTIGALLLYSRSCSAFGAPEVEAADRLASQAGVTLANAMTLASIELASHNLEEGLATRGLIGQAQGILMVRDRCSGEAAISTLRRRSQDGNQKLRDVAAEIVSAHEQALGEG